MRTSASAVCSGPSVRHRHLSHCPVSPGLRGRRLHWRHPGIQLGTIIYETTDPNPIAGYTLGVQVGYNFHLADGIVAGIEGDLNWSNEQGTYPSNSTATSRIDWDGPVRGRLGFDAGELLPYMEAGIAFANDSEVYAGTYYPLEGPLIGVTVGAGVEFKVSDAVSLNLGYRYTNYGVANFQGFSGGVSLTNNELRAGVNFHF
jgi:outer membrane immunogenic protein